MLVFNENLGSQPRVTSEFGPNGNHSRLEKTWKKKALLGSKIFCTYAFYDPSLSIESKTEEIE